MNPREEVRPPGSEPTEKVGHQASIVRTSLDQLERSVVGNPPWGLQPRGDLEGEQFTEQGTDRHRGLEVPAASHDRGSAFVVSQVRFIERRRHEAGKGDHSAAVEDGADDPLLKGGRG